MSDLGLIDEIYTTINNKTKRPNLATKLIHVLATMADGKGYVPAEVEFNGESLPLREALARLGRGPESESRHILNMRQRIRETLISQLPLNAPLPDDLDDQVEAALEERIIRNAKTNVSHAVSELEGCGLLERHYEGNFTRHHNRGGERHASYTLAGKVVRALKMSPDMRQLDAPLMPRPANDRPQTGMSL